MSTTTDTALREYFPLAQAPHCGLPHGRDGKPIHAATVFRWATKGVRGTRLRTKMIGAVRYTNQEAIAEFVDELTRKANPAETRQPSPTRRRSEQTAAAKLRADGLL